MAIELCLFQSQKKAQGQGSGFPIVGKYLCKVKGVRFYLLTCTPESLGTTFPIAGVCLCWGYKAHLAFVVVSLTKVRKARPIICSMPYIRLRKAILTSSRVLL